MNAYTTNEMINALSVLDSYKAVNPDKAELIDMFCEFAYREQADNVEFSMNLCRPSDIEPGAYEVMMEGKGKAPWIDIDVNHDNIYVEVNHRSVRTCFDLDNVSEITYFKTEDKKMYNFREIHFQYKDFEFWFKFIDWKAN